MPRQRKPKIEIKLPSPAPHPCPQPCECLPTRPYIRVSRVGDRKYLISPEIQMRSMDEWAVRKKRRLLEPACDINKSGRTFRKRSVDKIIDEISNDEYHHVVLWKWSRWARNQTESAIYLKKVREAGGRVDSATEDYDADTAIGKLTKVVNGAVDEYQSDLQADIWQSIFSMRRDDGLPHGGRERFGYDYVEVIENEVRVKRYVQNDEAEVLKGAYLNWLGWNEVATAKSFNKICEELNRAGWVTTLGGSWTPQGVARMMDTGFAAGLIRERSAPNGEPANSIKSYDIWRLGSHNPILDQETWTEYYSRRVGSAELPSRSQKAVHGLSALLFCSVCRRRLSTKYGGAGRTHQWQCPWRKSYHPDRKAVTVNNRLALVAVRDWVRREFNDELPVGQFVAEAGGRIAKEKDAAEIEQAAIARQIRELERKIENLVREAEDASERSRRRFNARIDELDQQVEELSTKLTPKARKMLPAKSYEALRKLDEVWDELPPEVLREFLGKLVSRIEISPRTSSSTRSTATDRVDPVGVWEGSGLDDWLSERRA